MLNGDLVIENKKNVNSYITFEGVGEDAVADGWGIRVKSATNIEIRNIGTMNCNSSEGDNIGLQQDNDYIWVHNVDFFYGNAGSAADQIKGDGALDCKKSTYVTLSYNHFWDSGKSNLLGLSEGTTAGLYITYHHNWYDHSDSRHPRVRYYSAHVYNNYYDGNAKYGVGSTMGSSVFVENNYFRHCKYPMLTSMQGSDIFNPSLGANDINNYATFSKEDGGTIKAFNNYISQATRFVPYGDTDPAYNISGVISSTIDFDAYVATTRNENVGSSVISSFGNNTYNNFDTNPAIMYSYTPDTSEIAKDNVMLYSGRIKGGDFKWTFNDLVDDISSDVNTPLKTALTNYITDLVYVQGEAVPSSQTLVVSTANSSQDVIEGDALNTIILTWGGDATDVTVSGLPSSGITFVKDNVAKTVTISGTPTADVSYTITTVGTVSTPVSESGTISVLPVGSTTGDEIHNFTVSEKTSTFYGFGTAPGLPDANMNSTNGLVTYDGLTLTRRLKIESTTSITYTTTAASSLTLVFDSSFSGKIKLDNIDYTATSGVVIIPDIPAGAHIISKNNTANLFYIKTVYNTLGIEKVGSLKLTLYPNPVNNILNIFTKAKIEKVKVYSILGVLVKNIENNLETIDMSNLSNGTYLVKIFTNESIVDKIIIKK
jgi:pectate lyase